MDTIHRKPNFKEVFMRCLIQFSNIFSFIVVASQMPLAAEQAVNTADNIQAQLQTSAEQVQSAIEQILSTPPDQQTFDNTLGAWNAITEEIQSTSAALNNQMKADFPDKTFARESIQEYESFIGSIYLHNAALYDPLFSYTKNALVEDTLRTPKQQQIAHLVGVHCEQFKESMSWEDQEILATLIKLKTKMGAPCKQRPSQLPCCELHSTEEESFIPCGEVSASIGGDSNGNVSASVSASEKSDDGRWSVDVEAKISCDSQGNVTSSGEVRGTINFDRD